jgi:hypothetical protein
MIKTQIQMPDALYHEAKRLAEAREMSLAELVRRGLEYMIATHPDRGTSAEWEPPAPVHLDLYADPFSDPDWRVQANLRVAAEGKVRYGK